MVVSMPKPQQVWIYVNKMIMTHVYFTCFIFILHRIQSEESGTVEIETSGQTGASYRRDQTTSYTGQQTTEYHILFVHPFIHFISPHWMTEYQ